MRRAQPLHTTSGRALNRRLETNRLTQRRKGAKSYIHPQMMPIFGGNRIRRWAVPLVLLLIVAATAVAQRGYRRSEFRPEYVDRGNLPVWKTDERFKGDLFTFV